MQIPITLISHFQAAILEEISRLEEIWKICGDDWPDDFDPNDIPMLISAHNDLRSGHADWGVKQGTEHFEGGTRTYEYSGWASKSRRFVVASIPQYVRRHVDQLSLADYDLLFLFYAEFCMRKSLDLIVTHHEKASVVHLRKQLHRRMLALEAFPVKD